MVVRRKIPLPFNRWLESARYLFRLEWLQGADTGRRQIASDAAHAETIGAVRRDAELDDRIVETHDVSGLKADGRVIRQIDDPVVVFGDAHLALREQHTVRFDAAYLGRLEIDPSAWDMRAGRGEHANHASARIRGTTYDLYLLAVARIDETDAQAVGVGMLFRAHDFRRTETF